MKFSEIPLAQTIVQLCYAKEIEHIVICPGSRNAPLTIGFTENPYFKVYSIVDERSAAFFAMGIAQQTRKPAVVVCTSGSALLNFYPAVAEAFYSDIPLVIISADRPPKFLDIGDGQTIRQENVFQNHIMYSANLKIEEAFQIYNETQVNIALNSAFELQGPVHINAPFEEPLYGVLQDATVRPQHVPVRTRSEFEFDDNSAITEIWNTSKRKLILVGVLLPDMLDQTMIEKIAEDPSVLVFTETTSNLHHPNFITSIDTLIDSLSEDELKELQPDLLLTFGGMVISKKIKAFLRKFQPKHHWHAGTKKALNTYFCLSEHFKIPPHVFLEEIYFNSELLPSDYQKKWLVVRDRKEECQSIFSKLVVYSDFKVFETLFRLLPEELLLQLSNSSIIRYAQLFKIKKSVAIYCNRGTSGIDGSTSTAVGASVIAQKQTLLITGDLSFFYDINGLWNNYIPENFRIIIINNQGGGIFRILQGDKENPKFDTYFETVHQRKAKKVAEMFGFEYQLVEEESKLQEHLISFFDKEEKPKIMEIITPRKINDLVLKEYFTSLK